MSVTALELAKVAAVAADDKKATDICLFDVSELSDVCDYFLIVTADNTHLAEAIVSEVEEKVRLNCQEKPISIEGEKEKDWILMDYGVLLVNVFIPEAREYYRLESLWGDAPRVILDLEGEMDPDLRFTVETATSDSEE